MVARRYHILFVTSCLLCLQAYGSPVLALEQVFYFLSLKGGSQNTGQPAPISSNDQYLKKIEKDHGKRKEDRLVDPIAVSFDFYQVGGTLATGFGMELNRYNKNYSFKDTSSVKLEVQAVLFAFSTFYRGDYWFPYLALGTGGYSMKIREKLINTDPEEDDTQASYIDNAPSVFYYELGSRFPLGAWGLLVSWRATSAKLKIQTIGKRLELGGQTTFFGFYYSF